MNDADLRLDANAAAGLLAEIFAFDITTAECVCGGCNATGPVGSLVAYGLALGVILRCPSCDNALIRVSNLRSGYWIDTRGTSVLRVPVRDERSADSGPHESPDISAHGEGRV